MTDHGAQVAALYAAYDERDVERLLALVTADVDWPDGALRMRGRDAVRAYWTAQFARTRTVDTPAAVALLREDVAAVRIDQVVHDLDDTPISRGSSVHVLRFAGALVRRLDIVPLDRTGVPA